jgi:hypothetical protein
MICPEKFCILGKIMTCAENFLGETVSPYVAISHRYTI